MGRHGLPKRYTDFIMIDGKRHKLFDLPADFVERVKGRGLSLEELLAEWERYKREKEVFANG